MKKLMKVCLSLILCMGLIQAVFGCAKFDSAASPIDKKEQLMETYDFLKMESAAELKDKNVQNFDNAFDAFSYAKNYFENVSADYVTYLSGTARPSKGGIQNVYSEKYKSSKTNNFYYATYNYGDSVAGIDPSMSAKIYKENGGSFKAKVIRGKYSQSNKRDGVQKNSGKLSADYTGAKYDNYQDSASIVKGIGIDPAKLSVYVINKNTVKNVNGFKKLQDGSYEFSFDLNEGSVANYKTQVKAFSGYPYKDFKSVNAAFKIDKYGRFKRMVCKDCYSVTAKFLISITINIEVNTREDFHFDYTPEIKMVNGNPRVKL